MVHVAINLGTKLLGTLQHPSLRVQRVQCFDKPSNQVAANYKYLEQDGERIHRELRVCGWVLLRPLDPHEVFAGTGSTFVTRDNS